VNIIFLGFSNDLSWVLVPLIKVSSDTSFKFRIFPIYTYMNILVIYTYFTSQLTLISSNPPNILKNVPSDFNPFWLKSGAKVAISKYS